MRPVSLLVLAAAAVGCGPSPDGNSRPSGPAGTAASDSLPPDAAWLPADALQRDVTMARHLRGLDMAMVEIGYRYGELYWAGRDCNWPYAEYQAGKIALALGLAVERRPRRAPSAALLTPALEEVRGAITGRNRDRFATAFQRLTTSCNACHAAEQVAFMRVATPSARHAPIRAP